MAEGKKVLIIDDELQIRRFLRVTLEANGYQILEAPSAKEGIYKAATEHPDAIVLDLGLPDMDGSAVLKQVREWSAVPVIILSVRDDEKGKVAALDAGADDYVVKPFGVNELIARLRVALRHGREGADEVKEFQNGDLFVDLVNRTVKVGGSPVKLTATEYSLLIQFVKNAGKVLTHRHLMKEIWGPYREEETQYLRVYVAQLRKKLETDPARPKLFITESGVGYRMPVSE
ncbi:MAG TPA: response regulator [Chitinivibrionales bacterium]|jgi:two-component system KDP operon response regulator KdpE|nr:response regulator [Chitinivibrionales bacterium]